MRDSVFLQGVADNVPAELMPVDARDPDPIKHLTEIAEQLAVLEKRSFAAMGEKGDSDTDKLIDAWYKYLRVLFLIADKRNKANHPDTVSHLYGVAHESFTALTHLQHFATTGKYLHDKTPDKLSEITKSLVEKHGL